MATIVLVHGSTQNSSCWDRVRALLAGHDVIAVELPKSEPAWTADDFANVIIEAIDPQAKDLIVVAHSANGLLLPVVASRRPVRALIYLAALVPTRGSSVVAQFTADPSMLLSDWKQAGSLWADSGNWRELADRFLFHDVAERDREWSHTTVQPMRTDGVMREPQHDLPIAPGRSIFAIATQDRTINPEWQQRMWRQQTGTDPLFLEAGHCPQNSIASQIARLILTSAD